MAMQPPIGTMRRNTTRELTAQSIIRQVDQSAHIMLSRSSDSLEHLKNARLFFERGMVPPGVFIPIAEDNGLMKPITLWVVDEALRQAGKWRRDGLGLRVAERSCFRSTFPCKTCTTRA